MPRQSGLPEALSAPEAPNGIDPLGMIAALARAAAATPERPFLFFVRGLDWRWLSYRETAERVGGVGSRLAGLPSGVPVGFPATAGLSSLLVDLAIRATGRAAVPVGPLDSEPERDPELARLGARAFVSLPGFAPSATVPTVEMPDPLTLSGVLPDRNGDGGALIEADGCARIATPEEIAEAAKRFERPVAANPAPSFSSRREIAVVGSPSRALAERPFLDWAVRSGAACLFEPDPSARAASAAWGRSTVHLGSAVELVELFERARRAQRVPFSRSRLPFDRLHTVFPTGEGLPPKAAEEWRALGVRIG